MSEEDFKEQGNTQVIHLQVAPWGEVRVDMVKNAKYLLAILVFVVVWILLISLLIRIWETSWSYLHACYFTVINMTTVGFGDVVPAHHWSKVLAGVNAFVGLIVFGIFVAIVSMALHGKALTGTEPIGRDSQRRAGLSPQSEFLRAFARFMTELEGTVEPSARPMGAHVYIIIDLDRRE